MLIPIGTDVKPRRAPVANWLLIAANVGIFFLSSATGVPEQVLGLFTLNAAVPTLSQYISYQFLHGDMAHLAGNMLFLWIFGNAVCDRMGSLAYLLFYLGGGVFAGIVFAQFNQNPLLGASGSIAAVTTAFLVLYPGVQVTMLLFLFIVTTFQVPAMVLIVVKIILWDNILAPRLDDSTFSNVAYSAHLGGYAFGFIVPMLMLAIRALPRNQFDLLGMLNRWQRRHGLQPAVFGAPGVRARPVRAEEIGSRPLDVPPTSPVLRLREEVLDRLTDSDLAEAARLYLELLRIQPGHVLPRAAQLEIAKFLTQHHRHVEAAAAYEAFLAAYPGGPDRAQVQLLLGLLYNRHLRQPQRAAELLAEALDGLTAPSLRDVARQELATARAASGEG